MANGNILMDFPFNSSMKSFDIARVRYNGLEYYLFLDNSTLLMISDNEALDDNNDNDNKKVEILDDVYEQKTSLCDFMHLQSCVQTLFQ